MSLQSHLVYILPEAWSHVPHFLIGGTSDNYHDALILGLSARGKDSLMGCIAISKNLVDTGYFHINALQAVEGPNTIASEAGSEYWRKFPRNSPQVAAGTWELNWKRDCLTSVELSQWYSYYPNPPLILPDHVDYFETFTCLSPTGYMFSESRYAAIDTKFTPRPLRDGFIKWAISADRKNDRQMSPPPSPGAPPMDLSPSDDDKVTASVVLTELPTCFELTSNAGPYYRWLNQTKEGFASAALQKFHYVDKQHPLDKFLFYNIPHELWYASTVQQHVPFLVQRQMAGQVGRAFGKEIHKENSEIKSHATLEYGICLLTGFGVDQDIDFGLQWVQRAAQGGSRLARAVTYRLQRAYGRRSSIEEMEMDWLVKESICFSPWALKELEYSLGNGHAEPVRCLRLFLAKYTEDWGDRGLLRDGERDAFERMSPHLFKGVLSAAPFGLLDMDVHRLEEIISTCLAGSEALPGSNKYSSNLDTDCEECAALNYAPSDTMRRSNTQMQAPLKDRLCHAAIRYTCCIARTKTITTSLEKRSHITPLKERLRHVAIRYACCMARPETISALLEKWSHITPHSHLYEYLLLVLHRGCTPMVMDLLERGALTNMCLSPSSNLLFLLHHITPQDVGPVVRILASKGFDVNQKAHPLAVEQNALYPTAFVTNGVGDPLAGWDFKLKRWIRARWLHFRDELGGESVTPLRWAIAQDRPELVQALVDAGAEFPKIPDRDTARMTRPATSWPPELCKVYVLDQPCYNIEILRIFLALHGPQQRYAPFAETPLGLIVMEPDGPCRRMRMADYNDPDKLSVILSLLCPHQPFDEAQLLWAVVMNNHKGIVHYLAKNVDIEIRHKGMTPLHTAILHGQLDIMELLLECGADARAITSDRGLSVFHLLFWKTKPRKVESTMLNILLEHFGGDISPICDKWRVSSCLSPLYLAVIAGNVDGVRNLIELGADLMAVVGEDIQPTVVGPCFSSWGVRLQVSLMATRPQNPVSSYLGDSEDVAEDLLRLLVPLDELEPEVQKRAFYCHPEGGRTVLHLLAASPLRSRTDLWRDVVRSAQRAGLDLNTSDSDGDTPLHYACVAFGGTDEQKHFMDETSGANYEQRNNVGLAPLEARFWSFTGPPQPSDRGALEPRIILSSTHNTKREMKDRIHAGSANLPNMAGGQVEQAWWEMEKGVDILWWWDAKEKKETSTDRHASGVKITYPSTYSVPGVPFNPLNTVPLAIDMQPSQRLLSVKE